MKKLNLLSPNLCMTFLESNNGEKVEYLRVPETLTIKALKQDVNNGADFLKEVLDGTKKRMSRVIVIRSDNFENGLMAVNYLAGVCNELDKVKEDSSDFLNELQSVEDTSIDENFDVTYVFEMDEYDIDEFEDIENEDEEDEDISLWKETPHALPIISFKELNVYDNGNMERIFGGDFASVGKNNSRNKKPYWVSCTKEAVCIHVDNVRYVYNLFSQLNTSIERFAKNKKVFILISEGLNNDDPFWEPEQINDDRDFMEFVLNNTADVFSVITKEDDLKSYRLLQFENWISHKGLTLEKKFPKKEIVEKIVSFKSEEKSSLIEKILRYVMKESDKDYGAELTKEDFGILKKFSALSMEEKKEKSNAKKLETELVGMDNVKEHIRNIVNLMKYNKQREKLGLEKVCFHNAHLLIGAPGTAKTTVARLMGEMMFEENLLPNNRFICVNGADLKGAFVGHSAPKTHQIIENHDVILIDEAYSLTASHHDTGMDSFSQESIAQLILEIENHPMDKLILFAGYGGINVSDKNNKMKQFIDSNPGLKSRINSTIYFDSYTAEDMVKIVHLQAKIQKLEIDKAADASIYEYFKTRVNDDNFGNGREARSLLENAMLFTARRVMKNSKKTKKMMNEISKDDVLSAISQMQESDKMQVGRLREKIGF